MQERLRDKTRDTLAEALQTLGVPAEMAERGRPEESLGKRLFCRSLGIIDIKDGPIAWVNTIKKERQRQKPSAVVVYLRHSR